MTLISQDKTLEALPVDVKTVNPGDKIPNELTPELAAQLMKQYATYQRLLGKKKRKMTPKDPELVIKEKKAKRRISNKNRKINQAKARHK